MNIDIPREDRTFIYSATANSFPASPLTIQLDGDSFFECNAMHFHSGQPPAGGGIAGQITNVYDAYTINFRELGSAAQGFFNTAIMPGMICSCGQNGKNLRTPIVFAPNTMLQIDVGLAAANSSGLGSADSFDIALVGVKRYQMSSEEYSQRRQRPYFLYASTILSISSFPSTQYIQIATDGDFVVQNLVSYGSQGVSGAPGANVTTAIDLTSATLQITDEGSQKQIFENPMSWVQIAAQAKVFRGNNRLLSPLIFRRNSPIRLDFGGTGTGTSDVQFGFEGYKIKD